MLEDLFVRNLGIIVIAAAAVVLLARLIRIPGIVAYLIAGLLIGPIFNIVHLGESIDLISELGIVLLLFLVGLELNFEKIKAVAGAGTAGALFQAVLTTTLVYFVGKLLGFSTIDAIFIGILLTFSSTVIAVKLLGESNELNTLFGRISVGVLLVQDLLVVLILTIMGGLESSANLTLESAALGLAQSFGGMALLVALVLVAARTILPGIFSTLASSPDSAFVASLAWCFVVVSGAELMHLSLEIGAFVAGVALAQLPHNHELHRRVNPLMNFFLAVFFVSLGVRMQVSPELVNWSAALLFAGLALLLKPIVFLFINARLGYAARPSFFSALTMAQISEFSVILAAAGVAAGVFSPESLSLIGLVALISMAVSAVLIQRKERLFELLTRSGLLRLFGFRDGLDDAPVAERRGHVIVIGMNSLGRELVKRLQSEGEDVLAIDSDPHKLSQVTCDTLQGSVEYLSLLKEAGLPNAKLVVSALRIEDANDLLAYRCASFGVPCSIHAIDLSVVDNLLSADATYLMIPKVDGIKLQTRELRRLGFIK